jgi:acetyl esterase/lipase
VDIPGYWIHESESISINEPAIPGEKVVLFLHGGGYVIHSAHPSELSAGIPRTFVKECASIRRSLSVEYRLSTAAPIRAANQYPTALLDAFAGYLHLVKLGFKESDIILIGDSAGGNLALALVRYLVDHHPSGIPSAPGSLILLSPWTDVGESFRENDDPQSSQSRFANSDLLGMLNGPRVRYFAEAFVGSAPGDIEEAFGNAYISPASPRLLGLSSSSARTVSFKSFPRTWIDAAGFETLLDQIRRLKDAMVHDLGEEMVRYNEVDGTPHDYTVFPWIEPERSETLDKISRWIDEASMQA